MKTKFATALAVSSLLVTMVGASASAQETVKAAIPFDFSVAGKRLPAGRYMVRQQSDFSMLVEDATGTGGAMTIAVSVEAGREQQPGEATLVFHHYGEQYFLSQMWTQDRSRKFPESKLERDVARHAAELARNGHQPEVVYLAALIQSR